MISFILFIFSLSCLFLFLSLFNSLKALIISPSRSNSHSSSLSSSLFLVFSLNSMNNTFPESLSLSSSSEKELSSLKYRFFFSTNCLYVFYDISFYSWEVLLLDHFFGHLHKDIWKQNDQLYHTQNI